tara:strand:- start:79 stop:462 length:384 start_codon:yes stop_codon:yes gene_type:complete
MKTFKNYYQEESLSSPYISQFMGQLGIVKAWPLELKTVFHNNPEAIWDDFGKHKMTDDKLGEFVYGGGTRGTEPSVLKPYVDDYIKTKNRASLAQLDKMLAAMAAEHKRQSVAQSQSTDIGGAMGSY